MKWMELIHLRSLAGQEKVFPALVHDIIKNINEAGLTQIRLHKNISFQSDTSVLLDWDTVSIPEVQGSMAALSIAQNLKTYGLVEHSIWVEHEFRNTRLDTIPDEKKRSRIGSIRVDMEDIKPTRRPIMDSVRFVINDIEVECQKGNTILQAARKHGIYIPSLCYHSNLPQSHGCEPDEVIFRGETAITGDSKEEYEGCRLCVVQIDGNDDLTASCRTEAIEGMKVVSENDAITKARKDNLFKILAKYPRDYLLNCELRKVSEFIGVRDDQQKYVFRNLPKFENDPLFKRDYNLCIGCLRCVRACNQMREIGALGFVRKDGEIIVGTKASTLGDSGCRFCMACVEVCPSGAIIEKDLKPGDKADAIVPCKQTCPAGIDIPEYLRHVAQGQYDTALAVISEKVPFPNSLGHICFHPCEEVCKREKINEPIAICNIKRFAATNGNEAWVLRKRMALKKIAKKNATGRTVAIIGAGPAGLTAAYFLGLKGHSVTVFDKDADAGGMMRYAIPEFRLPKTVLDEDLIYLWQLGVKFKGNHRANVKDLVGRYDTILIASGNPLSRKLRIGGMELSGVLWGLDFLQSIRKGDEVKLQGKVVVIGGGHVAVNAALSAKRLGASEVSLVCLEKFEEMPANKWEIDEAIEEGIKVHTSWGPRIVKGTDESEVSDIFKDSGYTLTGKKIVRGASGTVRGVEFIRCVSVFDTKERFSPQYDDCEIQYFDADTVIFAIGQIPDVTFIDAEDIKTERGLVKVDKDCMTTMKGVFACGEAMMAPGSVIDAIAQGKRAASSIDQYLGGNGDLHFELHEKKVPKPKIGRYEGFAREKRVAMPTLPIAQRTDFSLVELGYGEEGARKEASRCLQCDLRLYIEPVMLPPAHKLPFTEENVKTVAS
jgi:formate dehydrogenase (NADP+) beta subunit